MNRKKIVAKLFHYYVNDDNFFDLCRLYRYSIIGRSNFVKRLNENYSDIVSSYFTQIDGFVSGTANKENGTWDDLYFNSGAEAHKQRLKQNNVLTWLDKYKAPYLSSLQIKSISNFECVDRFDFNLETECKIEFIANLFPAMKWKIMRGMTFYY